MPSVASRTSIEVWPASRSTIMLSWLGSRCCTMMKAMPLMRRKRVQKLPAGVKAASRGADCDDRKIRTRARGERPLKPMRSIRLDMMRTTSRAFCNFSRGAPLHRSGHGPYQNSGSIANYFEEASFAPTRIANPAMSTFRIFPGRDASIIVVSASPRPNGSRGERSPHERIDERRFRYRTVSSRILSR